MQIPLILSLSSDHARHRVQPQDQGWVPRPQPSPGPGDDQHRPGEVPEESQRLPGLQEERLPAILLHLRRRAALHPRQQ